MVSPSCSLTSLFQGFALMEGREVPWSCSFRAESRTFVHYTLRLPVCCLPCPGQDSGRTPGTGAARDHAKPALPAVPVVSPGMSQVQLPRNRPTHPLPLLSCSEPTLVFITGPVWFVIQRPGSSWLVTPSLSGHKRPPRDSGQDPPTLLTTSAWCTSLLSHPVGQNLVTCPTHPAAREAGKAAQLGTQGAEEDSDPGERQRAQPPCNWLKEAHPLVQVGSFL